MLASLYTPRTRRVGTIPFGPAVSLRALVAIEPRRGAHGILFKEIGPSTDKETIPQMVGKALIDTARPVSIVSTLFVFDIWQGYNKMGTGLALLQQDLRTTALFSYEVIDLNQGSKKSTMGGNG